MLAPEVDDEPPRQRAEDAAYEEKLRRERDELHARFEAEKQGKPWEPRRAR